MVPSMNIHAAITSLLKNSRFTEMLIAANGLDRTVFERWLFCPGMLFNSPDKWWGDRGRRDFPHEGIDLCLYRDRSRGTLRMDENTRIPVMEDGVVKAIFTDYLGEAVIIEHDGPGGGRQGFISFYAHTKPNAGVHTGVMVKKGDIIATLADTSKSKAGIIPHLHFSLGLPSSSFSFERFAWNTIRTPAMITLLDPLESIDCPCLALKSEDPACHEL